MARIIFILFFSIQGITIFGQNNLRDYVLSLADEIKNNPSRQSDNLDLNATNSLPIGLVKEINGSKYIICIDSAEFTPQGAYFNAYMALDFPGSADRIALAAKHIKFNPQGVIGGLQARLQLVSEHHIALGPNHELFLPENGNNYVEWDCNGFQSVRLNGEFRFSNGILIPEDTSVSEFVSASIDIQTGDIHNIITTVNISPFQVRGLKDFSFQVSQAIVDLSDQNNHTSMQFPQDYPGDISTWRGFYMANFTVKLPQELSAGNNRTSVSASNLLIDEAGVSGKFNANNVLAMTEGDMHGWSFSVNQLGLTLVANSLTEGQLKGIVFIPALDNNGLIYEAGITQNPESGNTEYSFALQPANNITMNCLAAQLTIGNNSQLNVTSSQGKFKPRLVLEGSLSVNHQNAELAQLTFQNLTMVTESPYITSGTFAFSSNTTQKVANYPISISGIQFGIAAQNPVLDLTVGFNAMDQNDQGFSLSTGLQIITKNQVTNTINYVNGTENYSAKKVQFSLDRLAIKNIHVEVNTQAFGLLGDIAFRENDPIYGKGFAGALSMRVEGVMDDPMVMMAAFGKTSFRYWTVDAFIPAHIPIAGGVLINRLIGGISYHMQGNKTNEYLLNKLEASSQNSGNDQQYVPNETIGIAVRAGCGFTYPGNAGASKPSDLFNGNVMLNIVFNASGGFNSIGLDGRVYMFAKPSDFASNGNTNVSKYVKGNVSISYDHISRIFDANLSAELKFTNMVTGFASTKLYIAPDLWYFHLGRPNNPASFNIHNLAVVQGYFEVGQQIDPMMAVPPQVAGLVANHGLNDDRDMTAITAGNGVAVGIRFSAGFNKTIDISGIGIYARGTAGAGFDMTMRNFGPTAHCSGSNQRIGMNGNYINGQLFAYVGLDAGVLWNDREYSIITANVGMVLQGKMPQPTYVVGAAHMDASILAGTIEVSADFSIEFGNNCQIVN